jgi:hypothetical protein
MAEKDIIQNMISRLGQSQGDRLPPELIAHFFDVDDRSSATLMAQARALASLMRFYNYDPNVVSGNWQDFFPIGDDTALLNNEDGSVPPHLGLFAAFLELYKQPQAALNEFTARHMDFQLSRVLRFAPRPAQPDHAHVVFELKKGSAATLISVDQLFSAGKDKAGNEILYRPVRDVVINQGKVSALHSVFSNDKGVFFAPVANSADGLGAALNPAQPKWRAFGGIDLPPAQIGLAVASPLLKMQEGTRQIRMTLAIAHLDSGIHTETAMAAAFEAYVTGPKGWLGPYPLGCDITGNQLQFSVDIPATDPAVVSYSMSLHGLAFATQDPVLQILLKADAGLRYKDFSNLTLSTAQLHVDVAGLQASLALENDNGSLNPKKAFQPFGPQPVAGSRFMIGSDEALSKRLTDLKVNFSWLAAPSSLYDWYTSYNNRSRLSNGISGRLVYQDRSGQTSSVSQNIMTRDANGVTTLSPNPPAIVAEHFSELEDRRLFALLLSGSGIARMLGRRRKISRPQYNRATVPAPTPRNGFITLALEEDFLHADYRKESVYHAVHQDGTTLNEPYTPTIQGISLSYSAESKAVDLSANQQSSFINLDVQFFHVGCFGQMREHAYLRKQLDYVADKQVRLLPRYPDEGELLIGLSGVGAGDNVNLLIQVAEGSSDPESQAQKLSWSVLCDNYWRPLSPQELMQDSSHDLRASGIVALTLPHETDTDHTWMPAGQVWLRAAIHEQSGAACQLIDVAANGVEVIYVPHDATNDPLHLAAPLAAGTISKLKEPQASVKKIQQPYASFGGRQQESSDTLTQRAAERLRHRNRCITPWDYERMLLEAFPEVHKVKCIPHADGTSSWFPMTATPLPNCWIPEKPCCSRLTFPQSRRPILRWISSNSMHWVLIISGACRASCGLTTMCTIQALLHSNCSVTS